MAGTPDEPGLFWNVFLTLAQLFLDEGLSVPNSCLTSTRVTTDSFIFAPNAKTAKKGGDVACFQELRPRGEKAGYPEKDLTLPCRACPEQPNGLLPVACVPSSLLFFVAFSTAERARLSTV